MHIEKILGNPRIMRSITSLNPEEFEQLISPFEKAWEKKNARQTFEGTVRQRKVGAGRKGHLGEVRQKMFFILMYFKLYPIQEEIGRAHV